MTDSIDTDAVEQALLEVQTALCSQFAAIDGKAGFVRDRWQREAGGYGITSTIENGAVFEKGGVNFSHVTGTTLPPSASANRPELAGSAFRAMGVSVVMHPQNPMVPISHANVRFFVAQPKAGDPVWWFGGGFDLTPCYGFESDCISWHQHAREVCDRYGDTVYTRYKKQCDDYFYLPHRDEARGIGGIFFDDLSDWGFQPCFDFILDVAKSYGDAYSEIAQRRKDTPFTAEQREFQIYRRGRYVEFNLVYDRGTLFGLQSGGRVESILMSLPPRAGWQYGFTPAAGSEEARLTEYFLQPQDWAARAANE